MLEQKINITFLLLLKLYFVYGELLCKFTREKNHLHQTTNKPFMETLETSRKETLSIGDWLITLIISAIPLVNLIMLFVWSFSSGTHPSKANWAKATLILIAIVIILYIIFFAIFGATIFGLMENESFTPSEY